MTRQQDAVGRDAAVDKKNKVSKPFTVYRHKRRKYVRLEINSPIKFKVLNSAKIDLNLDDKQTSSGTVLNISGGGVLMETDYTVREDDFLVMEVSLKDSDPLSGIVGKVKRADINENEPNLIGVEFLSPQQLKDELPDEILEHLDKDMFSFDEQVKRMLMKYVFSKKVEDEV